MLVVETKGEIAENETPVLMAVHELTRDDGSLCTLFVGNLVAASDPGILLAENVTSSLNVSLNIFVPEVRLADGTEVRRAKVGLIDGEGNLASHLAAAVLTLHGLVTQASPGKAYYPPHRPGNVLVNCRGGRSRSVMVLALYMHLIAPETYPTLDSAVSHIRTIRGNSELYPLEAMLNAGAQLVKEGSLRALVHLR